MAVVKKSQPRHAAKIRRENLERGIEVSGGDNASLQRGASGWDVNANGIAEMAALKRLHQEQDLRVAGVKMKMSRAPGLDENGTCAWRIQGLGDAAPRRRTGARRHSRIGQARSGEEGNGGWNGSGPQAKAHAAQGSVIADCGDFELRVSGRDRDLRGHFERGKVNRGGVEAGVVLERDANGAQHVSAGDPARGGTSSGRKEQHENDQREHADGKGAESRGAAAGVQGERERRETLPGNGNAWRGAAPASSERELHFRGGVKFRRGDHGFPSAIAHQVVRPLMVWNI